MPTYSLPSISDLPRRVSGKNSRKRVVVVTHRGANSLEFIGPIYVLQEANFFLDRNGRSDLGYDIEVATTERGPIFEVPGLTMVADRLFENVSGPVDTLMFQAVDELENSLNDKRLISWIERMSKRVRRVVSICVGTYFLAEAGLLDGKRATTHWAACEDFRNRYPEVELEPNPIYVKDGDVYTSAGATAGMDLTLALVEEDYGRDLARRVAQGLVMFLKRPGNQAQFSVFMKERFPEEDRIRAIQNYVIENPESELSVETLAEKALMSPRNFSRIFSNQVGISPGKFVENSRLELARRYLEETDHSLTKVAAECGYETADGLRLAFQRNLDVSPREYRKRFAKAG